MYSLKPIRALQALILSCFTIFALGFSHLIFAQSSMIGMEGMSTHSDSPVQCQTVCTTAIRTAAQGVLFNFENDARDPLAMAALLSVGGFLLLAIPFVVKRLHLLSSWRPPDRILLCGHFADGL